MKLSRAQKIALAIATVWPVIYMGVFFLLIFGSIFIGVSSQGKSHPPGGFPLPILLIFPLHFLTMLEMMALTVFYIVDVFKNQRVQNDLKALWAIVIFFGSVIGMAVYWFMFIWPEQPEPTVFG
jgi:hypothetical protein